MRSRSVVKIRLAAAWWKRGVKNTLNRLDDSFISFSILNGVSLAVIHPILELIFFECYSVLLFDFIPLPKYVYFSNHGIPSICSYFGLRKLVPNWTIALLLLLIIMLFSADNFLTIPIAFFTS